jgi:hypothetical protein
LELKALLVQALVLITHLTLAATEQMVGKQALEQLETQTLLLTH